MEKNTAIIKNHIDKAFNLFNIEQIIGVFLEGSQNYGLETEESDIDTKILLTPSFEDIALNKTPKSGTHICSNGEHMNYTDIRLYMNSLRKQNPNFIEILFTNYYWTNPLYDIEWKILLDYKELIGRYNPYRTVQAMAGMAERNYRLMNNCTETNQKYFDKYGYYPKALAHIFRTYCFLINYINGETYEDCLKLKNYRDSVFSIKKFPLDKSRAVDFSEELIDKIRAIKRQYPETRDNNKLNEIMIDIQKNIVKISLKHDLYNLEKKE